LQTDTFIVQAVLYWGYLALLEILLLQEYCLLFALDRWN
jgi:hypothetical protein